MEWTILFATLYAIGLLVEVLFNIMSFNEFTWFGVFCLLGALGIPLYGQFFSSTYFGPGIHQSMYNPFLDVIEFHIGRTHDQEQFIRQFLQVRRVARRFQKRYNFLYKPPSDRTSYRSIRNKPSDREGYSVP